MGRGIRAAETKLGTMVKARSSLCSATPRATTGDASSSADMPVYMSAPISRHAAPAAASRLRRCARVLFTALRAAVPCHQMDASSMVGKCAWVCRARALQPFQHLSSPAPPQGHVQPRHVSKPCALHSECAPHASAPHTHRRSGHRRGPGRGSPHMRCCAPCTAGCTGSRPDPVQKTGLSTRIEPRCLAASWVRCKATA